MRIGLRGRYRGLVHGFGCLCHTPEFARINERLTTGLSRRSAIQGIAAAFASVAAAPVTRAFADTPKPTLLTNLRLFDGRSPGLKDGVSVLVSGNTIARIVPAAETVADATVIDCGGRVVMPGLIDVHWHALLAAIPEIVALTADVPYVHLVAAQEAERTLMRGFTTVRDVGGPTFSLKRAIDEGRFPGPRIFPSGAMISQTSGHGDFRMRYEIPRYSGNDMSHAEEAGISAIADGPTEVLRRVREQLLLGASQIKIMTGGGVSSAYDPLDVNQFTAEEIRAAVSAASDWGTYVCTHVYTPAGIRRSLENGVKCIEHGQLVDEPTAKAMADAGVWWSLQPFLMDEDANPKSDPQARKYQEEISQGTERAYGFAEKFGIKTGFGTDILFNPKGTASQGRQLAKLARWMDNADVLRMATGRNGDLIGLCGDRNPYRAPVGAIEAGALADLLVVDGNPLADISLIGDPDKNMKLIMKDGRVFKNTLDA